MSAQFNVLDRGWIPVIDGSGDRRLMGVRQVLAEAHTLREISDPSPLEEYSLYRFLGLFLMDALRPKEKGDIRTLLRQGRFDPEQIERYIAQCRAEGVSFDLFDGERPFLQSRYDSKLDGKEKPVAALDCTLPSGNNHTHFIHHSANALPPDAALRKLLTTYWFCTAAAQGYPSGVYGAPPYFGLIREDSLFGTLVNTLIPTDQIVLPFDDPPVLWRRTTPVGQKKEIGKTSWLQGMLFPSRRICCIPDENGAVISVYLSQGENYLNKEAWRDPYVTYRSNDTSFFPLRPHAENPIWRNICDVIDIPGNHASQALRFYHSAHGGNQNVRYTLYGTETSQASYLSVQRFDFSFPMRLAEQEQIERLQMCVTAADRLTGVLRKTLSGIQTIPQAAVSDSVRRFEQRCEDSFWKVCRLADTPDGNEHTPYTEYLTETTDALREEYDAALSLLHLRAHALCDAEQKRKTLYFEIQKLKKEARL